MRPLTLDATNALLTDARTALLEFVVTEDRSYLFVVTRAARVDVRVYPLAITQPDLTDLTERFRLLLSTVDNRFSQPARELYDLLLAPAAAQLRGKTRLVIVPDGPLWEVPFQALLTPRDRYLADDHTVFYVPSLTVLQQMMQPRQDRVPRPAKPTLLALGNPSLGQRAVAPGSARMADDTLEPLPEAERQVQALQGMYGSSGGKSYLGADAREGRFKSEAANYTILHLATHGMVDNRAPMYSSLVFAQTTQTDGEDGLLEAWELMTLDLKADVVVLSACETARGRISHGEGMIGLTWALFVAGAPTTVVSQWKVRSDSTADLMIAFHRRLRARLARSPGQRDLAGALRMAALEIKRDPRYRHPFYWAPFVVIGNGY
jgi:CHAT domain-containing protein